MEEMMGQRLTRHGMLSMMDTPEMQGLASYLAGRRWRRDSEGHGGGAEDEDLPGGEDDDSGEEEQEDDDKEEDDKPDAEKDDEEKPQYTKAEYEKIKSRMKAADKRASDLQAALDKAKADSTSLDETTKNELADLKPKMEKVIADNRDLRLRLAFSTTAVKGVEWEDVDAALKLVDLSDVDIDDVGNVDKTDLRRAMKQLAKDKPYLVKKEKTATGGAGSGRIMNGTRRGSAGSADAAAIAKRFPAAKPR